MMATPDVAWSDAVDEFLEHYGVKGMRWGVRQDKGHEGDVTRAKKIAKLDQKFAKRGGSDKLEKKINRTGIKYATQELRHVNDKPEYVRARKSGDFKHDTPIRRAYYRDIQDLVANNMVKAATEYGTNASGTLKYTVREGDNKRWKVSVSATARHADDEFELDLNFAADGSIVGLTIVNDSLEQMDVTEEFLEHYGVKGMHWGRRKADVPAGEARATQKKPGTKVQTKGGRGIEAHEDAVRTALSKQIAKSSTTDALSTKELQDLVTRMNLEQQYSKLSAGSVSPGRKFVNDLLINTAKQQATAVINQQASSLIDKQMKKAGAK